MPIYQNYHIINGTNVIMAKINEIEEQQIDSNKEEILLLKKDDKIFRIKIDNILCYGEVDFNNKEELKIIDNFKFVKDYLPYFTRYDYEKHICLSFNKRPSWSESNSSALHAKFIHGCLGKPKRIILFKL